MKLILISKILRIVLGLDLLVSGLLFMWVTHFGVEDFAQIIYRLGYPDYVLMPIGIGKLCMGLVLLAPVSFKLRTYAYFALGINLFLATYSHLANGDVATGLGPVIFTLLLGAGTFLLDYRVNGNQFSAA
jgi:uncharacterized membrane protein YphA (DoxX/SURF4 family)